MVVARVPVACTLTVEDKDDRIEEWRRFFADHTDDLERRSETEAALHLVAGDASLLAAADLAGRELACCGFFTFALAIRNDGRWLEVTVPDEAAPVLTDFVSLRTG